MGISDDAGVPLADTQKDLTPLQRHVLTETLKKRQEEIDKQQNQAGGSPGGRNPLNKSHGGGGKGGETVQYVNENA